MSYNTVMVAQHAFGVDQVSPAILQFMAALTYEAGAVPTITINYGLTVLDLSIEVVAVALCHECCDYLQPPDHAHGHHRMLMYPTTFRADKLPDVRTLKYIFNDITGDLTTVKIQENDLVCTVCGGVSRVFK
jgi:hypothetical protein